MISEEMAAKFHLPPIRTYHHPTRDWYNTFLIQSDYIVAKATEAQFTNEDMPEEYASVLAARAECREAINAIDEGTYNGEEAMTDLENSEESSVDNVVGYEYVDGKQVQVEGEPSSDVPQDILNVVQNLAN